MTSYFTTPIINKYVKAGIEVVESHHEQWDGSGYPKGLSGNNIPLSGRILALCDVYDALTSKRIYKEAFSHEKSRDIILKSKGAHFDPDVIDAFLKVEKKFIHIKEILKLNHPEKFLAFFPGMNENTAAAIYGINVEAYRAIKAEFTNNAKLAADELLQDINFVKRVEKLPFKKGDVVLGFGDSITDDYQSWFEILSFVLEKVFGQNAFKLVNAGWSGDTSLQLIKRFLGVANENPDWIICMIGTNDAIRNKLLPERTSISFEETAGNLDYLTKLAKKKTNAEWIWMTPPNVNPETIDAHPFTEFLQNAWDTEDLRKIAEYMKSRKEPVIDIWEAFGNPVNDELLSSDGLHPSIKGYKEIVRQLVEQLT